MKWTPELNEEVLNKTPSEFEAAHPGLFTPAAVHIQRRRLRDAGFVAKESPIGRKPDPVIVNIPELPEAPSDEELWSAYDVMFPYLEKFDASLAMSEVDITVQTDRPFGVCFMSDFHLGSQGVDTKQLREDIDLINTCENLRVYMGGDGIDNFILNGLAHVHRDTSVVPLRIQMELFRSCLRKLQDKLLAVGTGNHDAWTHKVSGVDSTLHMIRDIPVLYTGEDSFLNLTVGEQVYTIYRKHRPPTSSRNDDGAGVKFMYKNGLRPFDVGVMEHHHTPHSQTFWGHGQKRWAIRTGSYKLQDGHAREYGYHNGGIGTPVAIFWPFRRNVEVMMSLPDAIEFLDR